MDQSNDVPASSGPSENHQASSTMSTPLPPAPPPTYAPTLPQIMIAPLPDAASFFWGRTVQGEVFVKGLGERREKRAVKQLSVQLTLSDHLPDHPPIPISSFPLQVLYPPRSSLAQSTSTPAPVDIPFSAINRFSIPLSATEALPGTLNLTSSRRGEVKYELLVTLLLSSGVEIRESVRVEGTPPDLSVLSDSTDPSEPDDDGEPKEVEKLLEKGGVRVRMLLDTSRPRLGDLLRLGVEIKPVENEKASMAAGPSTRPMAAQTLRPLRRIRTELFRRVRLPSLTDNAGGTSFTVSDPPQHLSLVYASGKSVRYPGTSTTHPPLRLLFTIPTSHLASVADQAWGEITQSAPYHVVSFFVRVCIGFGASHETSSSAAKESQDWIIEREVEIRRRLWKEPEAVVIEMGEMPSLGEGSCIDLTGMTDEQLAREAYRLKGRDVVGSLGTFRVDRNGQPGDLPPPFETSPLESGSQMQSGLSSTDDSVNPSGSTSRSEMVDGTSLPSFLESEAQMRAGDAPFPSNAVPSQRLVPVNFDEEEVVDRATSVGRRGSLGGELGQWVEYDGYETFSVAPPSVSASFGVGGSMDPPQDGDEDVNVIGGMMGRLGLEAGRHGHDQSGRDLIESLGLGEGTRVVDLQVGHALISTKALTLSSDDLPPGIDEPSLPALPDFTGGLHTHSHHPQTFAAPAQRSPVLQGHEHPPNPTGTSPADNPPSFDASEAAVERQRRASEVVVPTLAAGPRGQPHPGNGHGDAPPGYFGNAAHGGGPPAYS